MGLVAERKSRRRQALIEAAECAIAAEGLAGLRARDLAKEVGVALGAIYNLVADLDELHLLVASRTLGRLDAALAAAGAIDRSGPDGACEKLIAIGKGYRRFATDNLNLWRALFEHRMADDEAPFPEWALTDQLNLFRHILAPLSDLLPKADEAQRLHLAQTLFSAVHGVVLLGLEKRFVGVPINLLDAQIEQFVRLTCAGIAAGVVAP